MDDFFKCISQTPSTKDPSSIRCALDPGAELLECLIELEDLDGVAFVGEAGRGHKAGNAGADCGDVE
jgi:hypothetical protein